MKKLAVCLLACLMMLGSVCALADQGVALFTPYYDATISTPGVYATLPSAGGVLYTGPGTEYYRVDPFELTNARVHCLALAYDQFGTRWVLVEAKNYGLPWRGYVRLSAFSAANQEFLTANLPYESSYDALTPAMIAQLYNSCDGCLGPGEEYPMLFPLDVYATEGTLIMTSGNWALMELNEDTLEGIGVYGAKCRLWVKLDNLFY